MTIIYTLEHPITHEIRYVGKTCKRLIDRFWSHKTERANTHKCKWVNRLANDGLFPIINAIEIVEDNIASETEIYWIAQFKAWGFRLTNATEGGEGVIGVLRTQEWKDNIGKGNKGKIISQEQKQKLREFNLGRKHSEETKQKIKDRVQKAHDSGVQGQIKPVHQYLNNIKIASYSSAKEAALATNGSRDSIRICASGFGKSSGGFQWKYN